MCLWKSMKNDIKNGDEKGEEDRRRIMEWLNKAIENDKEWVKPYYRRAQLSLLQSPTSSEVISSSKADFQFVIQNNQQNAPFLQLSHSKITFLLSSLQEEKEE